MDSATNSPNYEAAELHLPQTCIAAVSVDGGVGGAVLFRNH